MSMLRIVSVNIRFDNPADGEHRWALRLPLLAEVLNSHRPDIVATQEGWRTQLRELEACLSACGLVDQHREWIEERMYPSVFVRHAALQVLQSGDVWLSKTPYVPGSSSFGSAFPRLMTWCELECRNSGRQLFFANLHLDHEERDTRVEQARVAANELCGLNGRRLPIVLAGDFNDAPDGPVREAIAGELPNLYDPWQETGKPEASSYHSFAGSVPGARRIDWVLLDRRLSAGELFLDRRSQQGRYPSDHFPVVCSFNL